MKIDSVNVLGTDYEIVPEIAPLFSTSQAYAVGDCVIKDAVLYKFIAAHSAGAWNASHVQAVQPIGKQVVELGGDVAQLNERIDNIEPGLSEEAKAALLTCFRHITFTDNDADYYTALENALYAGSYPKIIARYAPGGFKPINGDSLSVLIPYLTVYYYETAESEPVTVSSNNYTLSGSLSTEQSLITVQYLTYTTSFTVSVDVWDFIWDASNGTLPSGMTAYSYNFTDTAGAMRVYEPNWQMGYSDSVVIEAEVLWPYVDSAYGPSFRIFNADNDTRGRVLANIVPRNSKIATDITGSTIETAYTQNDEFHTIHFECSNGTYEVYIDGDESLKITGTGVVQSSDITESIVEIYSATDSTHKFNIYIKNFKVKVR